MATPSCRSLWKTHPSPYSSLQIRGACPIAGLNHSVHFYNLQNKTQCVVLPFTLLYTVLYGKDSSTRFKCKPVPQILHE